MNVVYEWALVGVIVLLWAVLVWCWYSYTVGHREVQQSRARRRENKDAEVVLVEGENKRLREALLFCRTYLDDEAANDISVCDVNARIDAAIASKSGKERP